jgi:predicted acyltransferase
MASTATTLRTTGSASPTYKSERLVSLDVYRGLTIAGMILVTDPGTYSAIYWPLRHAEWNEWTPTDMIFPSFLFISGVAMTFSFASRSARGETSGKIATHLVWRAVLLIVIGLVLNGFPLFHLHTLRIPGILQRIAVCYLGGGLLYLACNAKTLRTKVSILTGVIFAIFAGYWAMLMLIPAPGFGAGRLDSLGNLPAYIDRAVFGVNHLWAYGLTPGYGVTYDPEGLLSTLPALTLLLTGILVGEWLRVKSSPVRKALAILAVGIVLLLAGRLLDPLLPMNKRIFTTTFALFSIGFSMIAFSVCYWIVDMRRWRWWTAPALIFGTNAIFAFALSTMITSLFDLIRVGSERLTLHAWGDSHLFLPWLSPIHASLAYALVIVGLNLTIVSILYQRRIFVRI